ncbi:alkaline phosphatase family protein [Streptomyces cirratus]
MSQVLDALTANPAVWAKTAFFITYDENDGFFDHVVPPYPPGLLGLGPFHGGRLEGPVPGAAATRPAPTASARASR